MRKPKHRKEKPRRTDIIPWWAGAVVINTAPSDRFVPPVMNIDGPARDS